MPRLSCNQHLALDRLRHGLDLRFGGWATRSAAIDPRDLIDDATVASLVKHGLAESDGQTARLKNS